MCLGGEHFAQHSSVYKQRTNFSRYMSSYICIYLLGAGYSLVDDLYFSVDCSTKGLAVCHCKRH